MRSIHTKGFVQKALVTAVATVAVQMAYAGAEPSQNEIEQLRAEVAELRAMIANQQPVVKEVVVREVPAGSPAVQFNPKDLKWTTQKGAEVKLYGNVRADGVYVIKGSDSDFSSVASTTEAAKDKFRATVNTTRLGLDFSSPVGGDNKLGGKVEVDFMGTNNALRIRHAYLTYNNWLVGQTTSTFLSNHQPEIIDFSTNVGGGVARVPMVRYAFNLPQDMKLFVAAEKADSTGASGTTVKYKLPTLTTKLTKKLGDKGEASVRGLIERYDVNADGSNGLHATAWGVALGAHYNVLPALKVSVDASHGKGNSKFLTGANPAVIEVNDKARLNEFTAVQTGVTYKFNDKLRSTIGYGELFAKSSNEYAKAYQTGNKTVRQAWINLIYSPVKPLDLGIEYLDGQRKTFAGTKYVDNRVGIMARYSF